MDRVEAEEEILAEPAGRDLGVEVGVGGGDEADVGAAGAGRSRRARTRRSRATRRSFACWLSGMLPISSRNSVPLSASSKRPARSALASVNAPLHVAEELALEHALGEAAHVDGDEGLAGARRRRRAGPGRRRPCRCRSRR
ncbi:MAG: hypothetical protein V9G11_08225 [Bifidobacterium adolescentis]